MPELPEVESLRRGLNKYLPGQKIRRIIISKPKLVSGKGNIRVASRKKVAEFVSGLTGETLRTIERRAKNLIFRFKSGKVLLVHLKMSGQFVYKAISDKGQRTSVTGGHPIEISDHTLPNKHTHIIFEFSRGTLFYNDTRMFGYLLYYPSTKLFELADHFAEIGLEPFDPNFSLKYLREKIPAQKSVLKTVLMNQSLVTGLGNIYADEVCFFAGVRPTRRTNTLTVNEIGRIYRGIQKILPRAIELGGSSVATYRLADGTRGNYAREHKVYGRGGKECFRCDSVLSVIAVNGRTTVFCPKCQK